MNDKQKLVVQGTIVFVVLMLLFPPFAQFSPNGAKSGAGFAFIFSGPTGWPCCIKPALDVVQLLVQVFVVSIIGAAAWFSMKD